MIQPKDNSDNSWLVIADWMEENEIIGASELRESIYNPISSIWEHQYRFSYNVIGGVVGGGISSSVGGIGSGGDSVGGGNIGGGVSGAGVGSSVGVGGVGGGNVGGGNL